MSEVNEEYLATLKLHLEEVRAENARLRDENTRLASENRSLREMLDENGWGVLFNFATRKALSFFEEMK
ncbi:MAG TPA: hypothetical protein PLL06_01060 [Acidobacteriota bacterium]|nr:hypothetical protein [Acidobacteriota bacterium]HNG92887.1 hypothetical protein [Acidobacteriota bacterium]